MKRICRFFVVAAFVLSIFSLSSAVEGIPGIDFIANKIVFSVKPGIEISPINSSNNKVESTGIDQLDLLVEGENITAIERYYPYPLKTKAMADVVSRMYIATVGSYSTFESAMAALNEDSSIEFAEPYYLNYADYVPNDPMIAYGVNRR